MPDPTVNETAPDTQSQNPFELVAYLLFKVRHSLEDVERANRPPRWVRVARAREAKTEVIGGGIAKITHGFATGVSFMAELVLDLREILVQTDAGKALLEVSLDLLRAATDDNFVAGIKALIGEDTPGNPAADVNGTITMIKDKLKYIPEPEDIERLGHEVYRLLCIEQLAIPRNPDGSVKTSDVKSEASQVDIDRSGKIRLMEWAYDHADGLNVYGLGPKENPEKALPVGLRRFGSRWLFPAADDSSYSKRVFGQWPNTGATDATDVYEFFFAERQSDAALKIKDVEEVHALLEAMGYVDAKITNKKVFSPRLSTLLQQFQHINKLPKTGALDNATLNRLLNLDFDAKNLRRARPFDAALLTPADVPVIPTTDPDPVAPPPPRGGYLDLVNPDADHAEDEGLEALPAKKAHSDGTPGYKWYQTGALPNVAGVVEFAGGKPRGWISYIGTSPNNNGTMYLEYIPRFTVLQSRRRKGENAQGNFDGERWSEGEAASGRFFFAARHTEPWLAGRHGTPDAATALYTTRPNQAGQAPPAGARASYRAMIYQWVDISSLVSAKAPGDDLILVASCLRRSLYIDRGAELNTADMGRIALFTARANQWTDHKTRLDLTVPVTGSDFFPSSEGQNSALMTLPQIERSRVWIYQATPPVVIPEAGMGESPVKAIAVALMGDWQSAYDIDAYYDNVVLRWEYRKKV